MKAISLIAVLATAIAISGSAHAGSFAHLSFGKASLAPGATVSLNPQPIPPKEGFGDAVSLNPQPIPPGGEKSIIIVGGKGGGAFVSLNPQPIPPKEGFGGLFH